MIDHEHKMLRGIIFDLDGVVVDSHPAHKRAWRMFFASLERNFSEQELEFVVEGKKREEILRHFLGNLTAQQVRDYGARKEALFKHCAAELKPVPGLPEFLHEIGTAGLRVALASSASRARVEYTLDHLKLQHCFHAVISGDDVGHGKPDPEIFHLAARRVAVSPPEMLVCEDAVSGVEAAKAAGMKCLAIAGNGRGPILERAGADKIIPDFTATSLGELRKAFE